MPRINNVDLDKVMETARTIKEEPEKAKRTTRIEGEWILEEGEVQFRSTLKYEKGEVVLECDAPTFMGGGGNRPGPIHYCVYGLASCFMATLASVAAEKGIRLKRAKVGAECRIDFSKTFGIADKPITELARFDVQLDADSSREELEGLLDEAKARCPAIYSLTHAIAVEVRLEK